MKNKKRELENLIFINNKHPESETKEDYPNIIKNINGIKRDNFKIQPKIYFLFKDEELIYIGKTKNHWPLRIRDHLKDKDFNQIFTLNVNIKELDRLERYYIKKFKPPLNSC